MNSSVTASATHTAPLAADSSAPASAAPRFLPRIVGLAALAHLFNDMIQAVMPAIFPMLKMQFALSYAQIGWMALVYQITASLLQPWIGLYTDKHPKPFLLPTGMVFTMTGMGLLATAGSYPMLLLAAAVVGVGSATFHPEAARVARMASGGRFGTAQSTFQVGGNSGSAIGPLLAAAIVIPYGQPAIAWFMLIALVGIGVLVRLTLWMKRHGQAQAVKLAPKNAQGLPRAALVRAMTVIAFLLFAKFIYIASITNYFTFYLIERFALSVQQSQVYLFVFLASVAVGTFVGGPIGDRIGRRTVIWVSFLGVAPFALALPYANLSATVGLSIAIGLLMSSAFPALVVYAQEAMPGRVGMVSGIMFGLMFGIGGLGAAGLGNLADSHGVVWIFQACSYLPLLGLVIFFLPRTR